MLHDLLRGRLDDASDRTALTHGGEGLTYAELWDLTEAAALALLDLGVARHERVAIFLEKRPETVAFLFGSSLTRSVSVPVNPALKPPQVAHVLRDSGARVLVTTAARLASVRNLLDGTDLRHVVVVDGTGPLSIEMPEGVTQVLWDHGRGGTTEGRIAGDVRGADIDIATILYTSGSTGPAKGVVLSHRNLLAGAASVNTYLGNTRDDVILALLPLSFDAGLSQLTTAFAVGAHVVLLNYAFPRDVPRLCERFGVTGMTAVPALWSQLASVPWPEATRQSIRYFASTGGHMPPPLLGRLRTLFPAAAPILMYGLTEAFRSTYLEPAQADVRPNSIGRAIPGEEVLVLRRDGSRCAVGEQGELVHRGSLVALGYWNDAARTAERFRPVPGHDEPWRAAPEPAVWSGDTVVSDDEGYLYFIGRQDEMIKTSGYRVSPAEVEDAAYATSQVHEAVAFGQPDDALGQKIVLVVAGPGTIDGPALLRELKVLLPPFMVPRHVHVLDRLPRTPNGKLDRLALRTELFT